MALSQIISGFAHHRPHVIKHIMEKITKDPMIQELQEQIAFMQSEMSQLSDELYAQQKEMAQLRLTVMKLEQKLQASQGDGAILSPSEDTPPPHY